MGKVNIKFLGKSQVEEVEANHLEETVKLKEETYSIKNLSLNAPVTGTVYGTLLNYKGALEAMRQAINENPYQKAPQAPILYIKPANTVSGYGMPIPLPADVDKLEIGAALGIVIGRTATRVGEEEAFSYISGYPIVNDVSVPHDSVYRPAIKQKARDGFCPIGPWVVVRDRIADPGSLGIRVYINGEKRQENTTANLIRSVSRLIADVTDFMTLYEGDTLLVGVPENAPLAKAGDQIRIEIDSIGSLENTIVHEEKLMGGMSI